MYNQAKEHFQYLFTYSSFSSATCSTCVWVGTIIHYLLIVIAWGLYSTTGRIMIWRLTLEVTGTYEKQLNK